MKLTKKTIKTLVNCGLVLLVAALFILKFTGRINDDYVTAWFVGGAVIIGALGVFALRRFDPEAYEAEKKEVEEEIKSEEEIRQLKIKHTPSGTICEIITAMLLIVSWLLIFKKHLIADDGGSIFRLLIFLSAISIWYLVSIYYPKTMPAMYNPRTIKQLNLCTYRKRALAIIFAIVGFISVALPENDIVLGIMIALVIVFFILYLSKQFICQIK